MYILSNLKVMFYYYAYLFSMRLINTNHFYKLDNLTSLELYLAYDSNDSWRF